MSTSVVAMLIDSEHQRRNLVSRFLFDCACHVEPYECLRELDEFWPDAGLLVMHDEEPLLKATIELAVIRGRWIPIIAYSEHPRPSRVVDVIMMGAMDYFSWPITKDACLARLRLLRERVASSAELQRRAIQCRRMLGSLTPREREILLGLAKGASNKTLARELAVSPRTIEVHRANMMGKLGVRHLGEALSVAFYSGLNHGATDEMFAAARHQS